MFRTPIVSRVSELVHQHPNAAQFLIGMTGATYAQLLNPPAYCQGHEFKCKTREKLHEMLKEFRESACETTKNIANMIYGNNVFQDLMGQPISIECVNAFAWQLKEIKETESKEYTHENDRIAALTKIIKDTHHHLAHTFEKSGQVAGFYLHKIGQVQEPLKYYLQEVLKLPSLYNDNEPAPIFEEKSNGLENPTTPGLNK